MFNVIAYLSYGMSLIIAFIVIADIFISSLFSNNETLVLCAIMLGLNQIYSKIKTKPISQAIKELWNAKVNNKSNTSQEDTPKTYEEYKRNKK